jgi:hypothetical protein
MRNLLTITLMASLLSVVFSDLVIVASWKINEAYIARFMCIERDMPTSDCGGTCYLTAQLQALNNPAPESVPLATLLEQSRSVTATLPETVSLPILQSDTPPGLISGHEIPPTDELISDIFHPPRV